jgi:small subunit ribosomal protein S16
LERVSNPTIASSLSKSTNPATVDLKRDRIDYWTKNGAQLSDRVEKLLAQKPVETAAA